MDVKTYLMGIELITTKIEQKKALIKELKDKAASLGSVGYGERVKKSARGDHLEQSVMKYIALEEELERAIYTLENRKNRITSEIHNLTNKNYVKLLFKRYVEGKSLGKVAKEMGFDYDYIRSMHIKALKEFEKINFS